MYDCTSYTTMCQAKLIPCHNKIGMDHMAYIYVDTNNKDWMVSSKV